MQRNTEKIDDETAIAVSAGGLSEEEITIWRMDGFNSGVDEATSVGVGVAEVENGRRRRMAGSRNRNAEEEEEEEEDLENRH